MKILTNFSMYFSAFLCLIQTTSALSFHISAHQTLLQQITGATLSKACAASNRPDITTVHSNRTPEMKVRLIQFSANDVFEDTGFAVSLIPSPKCL